MSVNKLTKRQLDIMRILWASEIPMKASEIAQVNGGCSIDSVQPIIKSLIKKGLVEVDEVVYSRNVLARKFKATVSADSIEMGLIKNVLGDLVSKNITASRLVAAFLPEDNDDKTLEELNELEQLIKERKEQLLKKAEEK